MPYTAKHSHARIAPRKARLVADLVRGRGVEDALSMLQFSKKRAAVLVAKVVKSAVANAAEHSTAPAQGEYFISEARVDEGPVIKRFMPKDRGKAYDIKKRTSHIIISIDERAASDETPEAPKAKAKKSKKAAASAE